MNKKNFRKLYFWIGIASIICLIILPAGVCSSEVLYEGSLNLSDQNVSITSYVSDKSYEIAANTPLGILASISDLTYKISDKSFENKGILLLDAIDSFEYNKSLGKTWVCEVNGVILDDFGSPDTDGLNIKIIKPDDSLVFYYGIKPVTVDTADASVKFTAGKADSTANSDVKSNYSESDLSTMKSSDSKVQDNGNWNLNLVGVIKDSINQSYFEEAATCHKGSWKDEDGNEYTGIPLWRLLGWVDDETSHGSGGFNETALSEGYTIVIKGGDGFSKEFSSQEIGTSDDILIANKMNGQALAKDGEHPPYPLKLVGSGIKSTNSVGNIVEIDLTNFGSSGSLPVKSEQSAENETVKEIPKIHIVKLGTDGKTVINETNVDYKWMEENLQVIGDGVKVYKYEGITNNPEDVWDSNQTFPGGFKIEAAVKGTLVKDLVNLVGGMDPGTVATLVASDGYETKLAYPSIYPNPDALKKAGEPFIAWDKDGKIVTDLKDGYQLFFTGGDDNIFSLWDMHETMDSNHWHYYWGDGGVQYASGAGLAAKKIKEIKVYSEPESEWELILDGTAIGGLKSNISSGYFDSALVCQFGSNHIATYEDADGKVWEGMPLWFLCGFVDDEDQHSNKAYNETLADSGYQIIVTDKDGKSVVIESSKAKENSDYIIASIEDDVLIPKDAAYWPLVLTGSNVSEPLYGVTKIELKPLE